MKNTVYLTPDDVAARLNVSRKTAKSLMMEMNPISITGTARKRYRVTEESLDAWMMRKTIGKPKAGNNSNGSNKKLGRR